MKYSNMTYSDLMDLNSESYYTFLYGTHIPGESVDAYIKILEDKIKIVTDEKVKSLLNGFLNRVQNRILIPENIIKEILC